MVRIWVFTSKLGGVVETSGMGTKKKTRGDEKVTSCEGHGFTERGALTCVGALSSGFSSSAALMWQSLSLDSSWIV